MFFPRGNKSVQRQRVFSHMGVDQEGYFSVQLAKRGIRRKRHLHEVAHAANVHEHLIRSFFGKPSAKLANHRSPVLPLFLRPSTRTRTSAAVLARQFRLGKDVAVHRAFRFGFCGARFEVESCVESIQFEEITMRLPGRRTRPAVSDLSEIVSSLPRAARKL